MNEYKNVGTPGHVDYVEAVPGRNGRVIIIDESGMRYAADKSDLISICPTGHEAFFDDFKTPASPRLQNRETWRGKGKRRMPRGGR